MYRLTYVGATYKSAEVHRGDRICVRWVMKLNHFVDRINERFDTAPHEHVALGHIREILIEAKLL